MQQQVAGQLLDGRSSNGSFQPVGQMFSYPFSRSSNETEDGTHYPDLADIVYMCDLLGLRLKVIATDYLPCMQVLTTTPVSTARSAAQGDRAVPRPDRRDHVDEQPRSP